jgi:ligand-binding sensor domain-containing protein
VDFCFLKDKIVFCTKNSGASYGGNWNLDYGRDSRSLSENKILSHYVDANDILWIGTYTGGLCKYNPDSDRLRHYTISRPLPGDFNQDGGGPE